MLQQICNWIVLIAAVLAALTAIYKAIGKPFKFLEKKQKEKQREYTIELLKELAPKYLAPLKNDLDKLMQINEAQNDMMDLMKHIIQDILRQKIEAIYDTYKDKRKLPSYVVEILDELYADYKAADGNHHIDKLYARMKSWPIYEEKSKYDID